MTTPSGRQTTAQITTAQVIAQLLNTTDWMSIDTLLRMGYTREQVIRSYTIPAIS